MFYNNFNANMGKGLFSARGKEKILSPSTFLPLSQYICASVEKKPFWLYQGYNWTAMVTIEASTHLLTSISPRGLMSTWNVRQGYIYPFPLWSRYGSPLFPCQRIKSEERFYPQPMLWGCQYSHTLCAVLCIRLCSTLWDITHARRVHT